MVVLPSLREQYERRARTYPDRDRTAEVRAKKAIDIANLHDSMQILDIGCKDGVLLDTHSVCRWAGYTGVDIAESVLTRGRARHPHARFVRTDAGQPLPFEDRTFDRIFALEILEHLPRPSDCLEEARRLLAPGGRLILSVPNPYYYMEFINELRRFPDTEGHLYSFTTANLQVLLQHHGFQVEEAVGTYFLVPKKLWGPFRDRAYWIVSTVPQALACSRIYRCRPI